MNRGCLIYKTAIYIDIDMDIDLFIDIDIDIDIDKIECGTLAFSFCMLNRLPTASRHGSALATILMTTL